MVGRKDSRWKKEGFRREKTEEVSEIARKEEPWGWPR